MAFELIYTSVPQGIRPGSSGFCTVAYTYGLAANIALQLESLSAYKPCFPPYDENAGHNPVAYSHYLYSTSGEVFHILSRICFYGLDYTKRSNKLAHHIVLTEAEMNGASGGPTSLFLQEGLFRIRWTESPQLFRQQLEIQAPVPVIRPASTWERYTGDAGWAGMVAQAYLNEPEKPVFIIFDPLVHDELLSLAEEALLLLPAEMRWGVSFNTYFTALPAGIRCCWRFCPPGSEMLREARRTPGTLVIDLTGRLPQTPDGELQRVARTGIPAQKPVPFRLRENVPAEQPVTILAGGSPHFRSSQPRTDSDAFDASSEDASARFRKISQFLSLGLTIFVVGGIIWGLYLFRNSQMPDVKDVAVEIVSQEDAGNALPSQAPVSPDHRPGAPPDEKQDPIISRPAITEPAAELQVKIAGTAEEQPAEIPQKNSDPAPEEKTSPRQIDPETRTTLWLDPSLTQLTAFNAKFEKELLGDGESVTALVIWDSQEKKERTIRPDADQIVQNRKGSSLASTSLCKYKIEQCGNVLVIINLHNKVAASDPILALFVKNAAGREERIECRFKSGDSTMPEDHDAVLQVRPEKDGIFLDYNKTARDLAAEKLAGRELFGDASLVLNLPDGTEINIKKGRKDGNRIQFRIAETDIPSKKYQNSLARLREVERFGVFKVKFPERKKQIMTYYQKKLARLRAQSNGETKNQSTEGVEAQKKKDEVLMKSIDSILKSEHLEELPLSQLLVLNEDLDLLKSPLLVQDRSMKNYDFDKEKSIQENNCQQALRSVFQQICQSSAKFMLPARHRFKQVSVKGESSDE